MNTGKYSSEELYQLQRNQLLLQFSVDLDFMRKDLIEERKNHPRGSSRPILTPMDQMFKQWFDRIDKNLAYISKQKNCCADERQSNDVIQFHLDQVKAMWATDSKFFWDAKQN